MCKEIKTKLFYSFLGVLIIGSAVACTSERGSGTANTTTQQSQNANITTQGGAGHLAANYRSIDDLIKDSPFIVTGTVESVNDEFVVMGVSFALTKFKIVNSIRGEISGNINILQTKIAEDPFIMKGEKLMLFLERYEGPVAEDAYVMKGLFMGQYKIAGNTLIKNPDNRLSGSEALENIQTFIAKINETGYSPTNKGLTH